MRACPHLSMLRVQSGLLGPHRPAARPRRFGHRTGNALSGCNLGNCFSVEHPPSYRFDWRSSLGKQRCRSDHRRVRRNEGNRLTIHQMLAAHLVDRQKAHQCAAREPDQQLCADEQREPFMCPTGEHMNAVSIALQNQNLIPATKLTAFGFSPANRA